MSHNILGLSRVTNSSRFAWGFHSLITENPMFQGTAQSQANQDIRLPHALEVNW